MCLTYVSAVQNSIRLNGNCSNWNSLAASTNPFSSEEIEMERFIGCQLPGANDSDICQCETIFPFSVLRNVYKVCVSVYAFAIGCWWLIMCFMYSMSFCSYVSFESFYLASELCAFVNFRMFIWNHLAPHQFKYTCTVINNFVQFFGCHWWKFITKNFCFYQFYFCLLNHLAQG